MTTIDMLISALRAEPLCRTTKGALMDAIQEETGCSRNLARERANEVIRQERAAAGGGDLRTAIRE